MDTKTLVKFYGSKASAMLEIGSYRQQFDYWAEHGIPQMWQLLIEAKTTGKIKADTAKRKNGKR